MTKKEFTKKLLESKEEELLSFKLTEEYLINRIEQFNEKERRENLTQVQKNLEEIKRQIKFFKK